MHSHNNDAMIDFRTEPATYRHWKIAFAGPVATLALDVSEAGGLFGGYELKLNSYDLGVDIELYDAVQRLRFEHPEIGAVVIRSGKEGVFCAGANIRMLGQASHGHKANFCKFTNEPPLARAHRPPRRREGRPPDPARPPLRTERNHLSAPAHHARPRPRLRRVPRPGPNRPGSGRSRRGHRSRRRLLAPGARPRAR